MRLLAFFSCYAPRRCRRALATLVWRPSQSSNEQKHGGILLDPPSGDLPKIALTLRFHSFSAVLQAAYSRFTRNLGSLARVRGGCSL